MYQILLLAGCFANGTDSSPPTDSSSDTGTFTSTLPCPAYFGFNLPDVTYVYDYQSDFGLSGTVSYTLGEVSGDMVSVSKSSDQTWDDGGTEQGTATYQYRCDDEGAALVSVTSSGASSWGGSSTPWEYEAHYEPPALLIPGNLAPGLTWTTHYQGSETSDGRTQRIDENYDWIAVEETTITVPAGEFKVIFVDGEGNGEDLTGDLWLNARVGLVRDQYDKLQSF